jgi:hypothetical protein
LSVVATKTTAIARAQQEGKLILADFGRAACSECQAMQASFNTTPAKPWLLEGCVVWEADFDNNPEAAPYAVGLSSFALPLVVFIDPNNAGPWINRQTGYIPPSALQNLLRSTAQTYLPLVVTNLPSSPLTNASDTPFTVRGTARTNAAMVGAVVNMPIQAIQYRLMDARGTASPWQNATSSNNWLGWSGPPLLPGYGTNTIESYVQYQGGLTSWTNRDVLVYLGPTNQARILSIVRNPTNGTSLLTCVGALQAQYCLLTQTNPCQPMGNWKVVTNSTNTVTNASGIWQLTVTNQAPAFYRSKVISFAP